MFFEFMKNKKEEVSLNESLDEMLERHKRYLEKTEKTINILMKIQMGIIILMIIINILAFIVQN